MDMQDWLDAIDCGSSAIMYLSFAYLAFSFAEYIDNQTDTGASIWPL